MFHEDLNLKPYKIHLVHEITESDHRLRRDFADWALNQLKSDPLFYQKIFFTDEAHF